MKLALCTLLVLFVVSYAQFCNIFECGEDCIAEDCAGGTCDPSDPIDGCWCYGCAYKKKRSIRNIPPLE